jgi:DNA-binding response OmpR family regulator
MFSAMSTEDLQKILIDAGGDEASVKALSDEELRAAIVQALQELQRQQASSDSASSETPLEIQETPTN